MLTVIEANFQGGGIVVWMFDEGDGGCGMSDFLSLSKYFLSS